jgi:hypothetical protein
MSLARLPGYGFLEVAKASCHRGPDPLLSCFLRLDRSGQVLFQVSHSSSQFLYLLGSLGG